MFKWEPEYSVNVASIDAQHKGLLALGAELFDAMQKGQGKAATGKILDRLIKYTVIHFKHEESLMQANRYPDFASHKAQHDALTVQVAQFQTEFMADRAALSMDLLDFLKNWLIGHIQGSDRKYMPFIRDKTAA
jgi:hemerythrin